MGKYIIAGNWKMNKLPSETYDFVKEIAKATEGAACEVVCCTPYVCLQEAVKAAEGTHVKIGAENLHFEDKKEDLINAGISVNGNFEVEGIKIREGHVYFGYNWNLTPNSTYTARASVIKF